MKNLLTYIVCSCFFISGFSQITDAEYYIDTDNLGVGNQTALAVTSGNTIDEDFTIPTTGLPEGLHTLHIRVKGTNDMWSLYKRAYFYVQAPSTNSTPENIVAAEYYIDTDDLGVGNQTALTITPGMVLNETFSIPTTGLTDGLHVLHIRVKDADDTWSLYKRAYFYVQTPSTNGTPQNIVAAEYYIDTDDLGVGNQNVLTVTPGMAISEVFTIPTTGLTDGLHVLHIRVKDADDTWSLYKRGYFYTHSPNSNATATPIIAAEYFFDTDPGVGSATSVAVTQGFNIDEDLLIEVPVAMVDGNHYLFLRVQNQDGTWSLYKRALFTVDGALSVEDFNSESVKIFPNPTADSIHINFKQHGDYSFSMYDTSGKEIFKQETLQLNNIINLTNYASGIYILKIKDIASNTFQNAKIVKM